MTTCKTVGLVFEAWKDIDRALANLSHAESVSSVDGGSSFAWTLAHVTNMLDAWINVRFQQHAPHPLIGQTQFRMGGSGIVDDWHAIRAGVDEVRETARSFLQELDENDLDVVLPYDGSIRAVRPTGLSLRYALLRIAAHHYTHIGEIVTKREHLGQPVGDFPGDLSECI